ncbi:MAG TPA: response regulator transcription factor, partial [Rhodocyclaceae bacterium]|nr:response regulator transcription factor [Rhodocyclaceae bacterium]
MLRVAIVDDHQIVRAGFREMLADELGIAVAFEAASGEEALIRLQEAGCDVLLLDLALPGQSGLDVLRVLRQHPDPPRVLILTGYPEERYALVMIRHGADGYLCKDCGREELLQAVRTVAQGRRYLSPRVADLLAD